MRRRRFAVLLAAACALAGCGDDEPAESGPTVTAPVVVGAEDPAGDVELTIDLSTAPAEPKYAQIDLRGAELQRLASGVRLVYTLDGPVGVEGYRAELVLVASSRSDPTRTFEVYAFLGPDSASATAQTRGGPDGTVQCDAEVAVSGREVQVVVPERCVPAPFRGPVVVGTGLYTDSEDSETRLAGDGLRFEGRPGVPAAP